MRIHADPDPQPWLGSCSLSIVLIMFQMELEGVTAPGPEDRVIERDGAKVYIHPFTAVGRLSKNLYLLALATGRQQLRCRFR